MGYGFLYLMDDETDRRVEEYSVRNNYRIRFANFSRIYLQRNDKTRTRPMRGDMGALRGDMGAYGGHPRDHHHHHIVPGRPHDRPPLPPLPLKDGGRKPRRGKEEFPPLRQFGPNEPRLRHGIPGPPPPLPRVEPPELWNRYPADRVQPEPPAPYPPDAHVYESGYYEQNPVSSSTDVYYEDQQHYPAAHDHTGGYEDYQQSNKRDEVGNQQYYTEDTGYYQQSYKGDAEYYQQGYHGDDQQAHQGYGNQEQGYWNVDGQTGYYDGGGQHNEAGVYQHGEYYQGNHSREAYANSQQHGVARQAENHGYSQNRPYSAESPYQRENGGHSLQGDYTDANYSYPQEGSHSQNYYTDASTVGHRSYHQSSGNNRGGARGGYSHGGRGRGGGGVNSQRFQRRDRPY